MKDGGTLYNLVTLQLRETTGATDAVLRSITVQSGSNNVSANEECWRSTIVVPAGTAVDVARLLGACEVSFWTGTPTAQLGVTVTYGGGLYAHAFVAPIPAK